MKLWDIMQISITHQSEIYSLRNYLFKVFCPNSSRNERRLFCVLSLLVYEVCDKMMFHIVSGI